MPHNQSDGAHVSRETFYYQTSGAVSADISMSGAHVSRETALDRSSSPQSTKVSLRTSTPRSPVLPKLR